MKWNSLALNFVVVATVVVAHPAMGMAQTLRENQEHRRLFNDGYEFHNHGNYVESEKKFREALTKYPKAEQADRTGYHLILSLVKLGRVQDARREIENFRKTYRNSRYMEDVDEAIVDLGGQVNTPFNVTIWNSPAERREAQALADRLRGARTPEGPANKAYSPEFPSNASGEATALWGIIYRNPDVGIEMAREMLKASPKDPAVAANLGNIAVSDSPQVLPFLLSVWGNVASTPNMRHSAFFWFTRMNPDKAEVAKAVMDLLARRETQAIASEALYRMTVADHRAVLEKIVNSSTPDKFALMDKIYQNGSVILRTDLLRFVARLNDPRSVPFLLVAAQNDKDASVRMAALQELVDRPDVDVEMLQRLLRTPRPAPSLTRAPQPPRYAEQPSTGSGIGSGVGSGVSSGVIPLHTFPPVQQ